ncbi:MAG: uracil-DNA glycosylase family protein [Nanoarchaeota archaeon]|nr:uracil-DNA glycosylase family protein [Nanoarchaeota archaeon]MBU1632821.1 uracil-DNA glycosylase family protein [Nanoarchaeota archaeon]MBU1876486.1 uracil-DNA glycosylase family protein [Nanoarchaeota archaeon]
MANKKLELERLRERIIKKYYIQKWNEVWFFPKVGKIEGYYGTSKAMLVGSNPSLGSKGYKSLISKKLKWFYDILEKEGYSNAHLTDVIKLRMNNKEFEDFKKNENEVKKQIKILKEEIDIIKPKNILAMGKKAKKILDEYNIPSRQITHYSRVYRFKKDKEKMIKQLREYLWKN